MVTWTGFVGTGIVTNCWSSQLAAGVSLAELIAEANLRGFDVIELRQGALGECEDAPTRLPDIDALRRLKKQFEFISFDLAVELPIFSQPVHRDDPAVEHLIEAAAAVGGHLRIVDLVSRTIDVDLPPARTRLRQSIESLLLSESISRLSIEHSIQPWNQFVAAFDIARSVGSQRVQLCYDPCNLWLTGDGSREPEITRTVPVEWLSMLHLKQRDHQGVMPELIDGELDWATVVTTLLSRGCHCPVLFELASSDAAWNHLATARAGLQAISRTGGV